MKPPHSKLRPSGGYRRTASFQTTTLIYDATIQFCERFLDPRSRTVDQMVQAARSGRQNIAEGSRAAATSSQTELRLVNVARASLEELLLDFEDYLRHRKLPQWEMDGPEATHVRAVPRAWRKNRANPSDLTDLNNAERWALYAHWLEHDTPAVRANAILCLIHQANFLLDRQIAALEAAFVHDGGYSEHLATERLRHRRRTDQTDPSKTTPAKPPACPQCGGLMAQRTAKSGPKAGTSFWGCAHYPDCKGTVEI
jgi:four helix bundle suffix protein